MSSPPVQQPGLSALPNDAVPWHTESEVGTVTLGTAQLNNLVFKSCSAR